MVVLSMFVIRLALKSSQPSRCSWENVDVVGVTELNTDDDCWTPIVAKLLPFDVGWLL